MFARVIAGVSLALLFVFAFATASPGIQHDDNELEEEGVWSMLMGYGSSLYGEPSKSTGEKVAKWTPEEGSNADEIGEYAGGDILFPPSLARNGLKAASTHWDKGVVPYVISGYFSAKDMAVIEEAMNEYHKRTCVKWKPRTGETDYVDFTTSNTGCWSSVGKIGGRQELNLQTPGCTVQKGTVEHEMMHALGFLHEQNRWERDKHVTVNYDNIQAGRENNFEKAKKQETDAQGVAYDYHSVMHYSANAFSRNGQPTIVPKHKNVELGQRKGLSDKDAKKIKHMYKCK